MLEHLQAFDPDLARSMQGEHRRQLTKLEMIASENFTSEAVREAAGSVLTHKYAEGFPGKRYYGGCEFIDEIETLAIDRAKELFGAEYANVQPHSGSTANQVAYFAVLEVGDTVMGMSLDQGGHLTHGMKLNFSGRLFNFVHYGVDRETELIDYDVVAKIARESKPKLIVAGYTAYTRFLDFARFREIADEVGAMLMVDMAHFSGLVASGAHPSPFPYADIVTSTTHKTLRGPRSGIVLAKEKYGKDLNKSLFPGLQGGPLCHIVAGKAVAFKEAMHPGFKIYIEQLRANAKALGKALEAEGLRMVSGGTDNHMLLVDLTPFNTTGKHAEVALDEAGITCNKNQIPYDKQNPTLTSGIRLGTPALTTRGMKEADMTRIAQWIGRVLHDADNADLKRTIAAEVRAFCEPFPLHVPVEMTV